MNVDDDTPEARARKFAPGNTAPDGDYIVGKGRPPQSTKFAVDDGRRRGRRPKGQRNFDTEFAEEANRSVVLRENGKARRVSKLRSTIVRAFDNAGSKGQNQAIATIFAHSARIADKAAPATGDLGAREDELLEEWIARRLTLPAGDPLGDEAESASDSNAREEEDHSNG